MLLRLIACIHLEPPTPPKRDITVQRFCDQPIVQQDSSTTHILLNPVPDKARIPFSHSNVVVLDMVSVITPQGRVFLNDFIGTPPFPQQDHCKLSLDNFTVQGIGATVNEDWTINPSQNVLDHLDSGIGIEVALGEQSAILRFPPNYDSSLVDPYIRKGQSAPPALTGIRPSKIFSAASGQDGKTGDTGKQGTPGRDGSDAWNYGQDGGRGGDGGDGGNGKSGNDGNKGSAPGAAGSNGTDGTNGGSGNNAGDGGNGFRGANGGRGGDGCDEREHSGKAPAAGAGVCADRRPE